MSLYNNQFLSVRILTTKHHLAGKEKERDNFNNFFLAIKDVLPYSLEYSKKFLFDVTYLRLTVFHNIFSVFNRSQ